MKEVTKLTLQTYDNIFNYLFLETLEAFFSYLLST